MSKKLINLLLVVALLFTPITAFAQQTDSAGSALHEGRRLLQRGQADKALIQLKNALNLYTAAKTTLLWGGDWGVEDATHVAQLYGGYILPGSTLSDLHLSVSQWNTGNNSVYHVEQFRIQGLA